MRPADISGDTASMFDVLQHTLHSLQESYDIIVLLEPTSPLRKDTDIDEALTRFVENYDSYDSTVSLGKIGLEHPEICKKIVSNNISPYHDTRNVATYRQQLDPAYFPYGVIYASKVESLISSKTFYQDRTMPFMIERWQNYEIDDEYDFLCVQSIMKKNGLSNYISTADLDMRDRFLSKRLRP